MRTMYDSIRAASIPRDAAMVAGYSNGRFAWTAADWALFPRARHVRIDVTGADPEGSGVLDVERGDATPDHVPGWCARRIAAGHRAVIYCSRSIMTDVLTALARPTGLEVGLWVADWTGEPHRVGNAVAVQYKNTPGYDLSAVWDDSWHPAP